MVSYDDTRVSGVQDLRVLRYKLIIIVVCGQGAIYQNGGIKGVCDVGG
jgi:hypothetical protein